MKNSPIPFQISESVLTVSELETYVSQWLLDCEIRQHSKRTIASRRIYTSNLLWFLKRRDLTDCGKPELRLFLHYLTNGHTESGGRWGRAQETEPVKSSTVQTYHTNLRALFNWILAEGRLTVSPMAGLVAPVHREDQVQPFSLLQVEALLQAAKSTSHALRNEAILLLLLDTGIRNTELCTLPFKDIDMTGRRLTVEGKGGKRRTVFFSNDTAKPLWKYLRGQSREPTEPVFLSERGEALTKDGLTQLFSRLGKAAGITDVRCSPHTMRHTFAVEFLRGGGNQLALMQILGHTDMKMTARYVKLVEADIERQQKQFSPTARLKGRGK